MSPYFVSFKCPTHRRVNTGGGVKITFNHNNVGFFITLNHYIFCTFLCFFMPTHLAIRLKLISCNIKEIIWKISHKFWRWVIGQLSPPTFKILWSFFILASDIRTIVLPTAKMWRWVWLGIYTKSLISSFFLSIWIPRFLWQLVF